ncbi:MAG: response regulator [Magnetococcales bacterium]|nr:response regulator [Magnetococcales bacterium]NGZ27212.1 response regulator [Magnetococcales bacterium]
MEQDKAQKIVLVVDDSSLARMLIRNLLRQSYPDWQVVETKSAEEALEQLVHIAPSVALIDYNMPGMNGLDLALKILETYPTAQAHLVTANIQGKMQERAEAAGIGFITKPVSADKLHRALTANSP